MLWCTLKNREQATRNSERAATTISADSTPTTSPMRANYNDETDGLLKARDTARRTTQNRRSENIDKILDAFLKEPRIAKKK